MMNFRKIIGAISGLFGIVLFLGSVLAVIIGLIAYLIAEKSFDAGISYIWNEVTIWRNFALSWLFLTLGESMYKEKQQEKGG